MFGCINSFVVVYINVVPVYLGALAKLMLSTSALSIVASEKHVSQRIRSGSPLMTISSGTPLPPSLGIHSGTPPYTAEHRSLPLMMYIQRHPASSLPRHTHREKTKQLSAVYHSFLHLFSPPWTTDRRTSWLQCRCDRSHNCALTVDLSPPQSASPQVTTEPSTFTAANTESVE